MGNSQGRDRQLENTLADLNKRFGEGIIMRLGDADAKIEVPVIPTGAISLDLALGIGGYPRGRIVEIYGPESSGKTTLTLHAIAECQKNGGIAAFIDAEHALDPSYARKLGVNVDELLVSQPDNGEQALEIAEALVRSGGVDLVVVMWPDGDGHSVLSDVPFAPHHRFGAVVRPPQTCVIHSLQKVAGLPLAALVDPSLQAIARVGRQRRHRY